MKGYARSSSLMLMIHRSPDISALNVLTTFCSRGGDGKEWLMMWRSMSVSCVTCQRMKHRTSKAPGQLHPILASAPGNVITLDLVSKFSPAQGTRHNQCVVITDKFSRFVLLEGCALEVTAADMSQIFLCRVLPLFGVPYKVISDRGPQFSASLWQHVLAAIGSKAALAATHHPQTNRSSERSIQNLLRLIRTYRHKQQEMWERHLPLFEFALNTTRHSSTHHTPHEVVFGWSPRRPIDFLWSPPQDASTFSPSQTQQESPLPPDQAVAKWVQDLKQHTKAVHELVGDKQRSAADQQKKHFDKNRPLLTFETRRPRVVVVICSSCLAWVPKTTNPDSLDRLWFINVFTPMRTN